MKYHRYTPAEIWRAYETIRCNPSSMSWIDGPSRTCSPLVAIVLATRKMTPKQVYELFESNTFEFCCKELTLLLGSHVSYIAGFEAGAAAMSQQDLQDLNFPEHLRHGDEFEDGLEDGIAFIRTV